LGADFFFPHFAADPNGREKTLGNGLGRLSPDELKKGVCSSGMEKAPFFILKNLKNSFF
jgi:hypothetical protein